MLTGRRTLAHEAVVGLERLGGGRILDDLGHEAAQPLHDLEVLFLSERHDLLDRHRRGIVARGDPGSQVPSELGPEVAHQIRFTEHHTDERRPVVEVALALFLPTGLQRSGPGRIGRRIGSRVDRRRRALEDEELLGVPAQMRNQLNAGRAGPPHQRDTLVGQFVQSTVGAAAGVLVIPARGMEHMAGEVRDPPRDARQLRPVVGALRHHDEPGPDVVTPPVGADPPALRLVLPVQFAHLGGEQRTVVQPKLLSDVAAVPKYLGAVGEFLRRHEAQFLEHGGDVAVGIVVALNPPGTGSSTTRRRNRRPSR